MEAQTCQIELCGVATCDVLIVRAAVLVVTVFTCVLTLKRYSRLGQPLRKLLKYTLNELFHQCVCLCWMLRAPHVRTEDDKLYIFSP